MRFDFTDLRLFLFVVEAGSITHGAVRANLALPSASERLRGMEEAGGVALLERGRRGVTPTQAGEALAHHARLIFQQMERMRGELSEFSQGLRGTVRLLANTAAVSEFLPAAIAPWLARNRQIDIDLKERTSSEIVKAVSAGLADIGIISDAADSAGLALKPFALDRLVLICPPQHPLAGRRRIPFSEALPYDFVGLGDGSALQDYISDHAARAGTSLTFRMRVRSFEGICRLVAAGVGIGIVSESAARKFRRTGSFRLLRFSDAWATRKLSLCCRDPEALSPIARDLLCHLTATAGPAPKD